MGGGQCFFNFKDGGTRSFFTKVYGGHTGKSSWDPGMQICIQHPLNSQMFEIHAQSSTQCSLLFSPLGVVMETGIFFSSRKMRFRNECVQ